MLWRAYCQLCSCWSHKQCFSHLKDWITGSVIHPRIPSTAVPNCVGNYSKRTCTMGLERQRVLSHCLWPQTDTFETVRLDSSITEQQTSHFTIWRPKNWVTGKKNHILTKKWVMTSMHIIWFFKSAKIKIAIIDYLLNINFMLQKQKCYFFFRVKLNVL